MLSLLSYDHVRISRLGLSLLAIVYGLALQAAGEASEPERAGWSAPAPRGVIVEVNSSGDGVRFTANPKGSVDDGSAFVRRKQSGDFVLEATIESDSRNTDANRAGLMVRVEEDAAAVYFAASVGKAGVLNFEWREQRGGEVNRLSQEISPPVPKLTLRLERQENRMLVSQKVDAGFWKVLFKQRIPELPNAIFVGPFVSSPVNLKEIKMSDLQVKSGNQVTIFEKVPPESSLWKTMMKKIYYQQLWLSDEKQLSPASKENPRGYTTGSPWPSTYKKPDPLIPGLDVKGPDGLIYPNFTRAGVVGGIQEDQPILTTISADTSDLAGDIESAIAKMGEQKRGVIVLRKGVFTLSRPLRIVRSGVVIRGSGSSAEGTLIKFTYGLKEKEIRWNIPTPVRDGRSVVGSYDRLEVHADICPKGNEKPSGVTLTAEGKPLAAIEKGRQTEGTFRLGVFGRDLFNRGLNSGPHTLKATVQWPDGTSSESTHEILLDPTASNNFGPNSIESESAIFFSGEGPIASVPLSASLKRGDTTIDGLAALNLKEGDFIRVYSNESAENGGTTWRKRVKVAAGPALFREMIFQVKAVKEGGAELNQPARIEIESAPYVQVSKTNVIQDCGIENLSIETTEPIWMNGVLFRYAANCWVRNVRFEKPGRNGFWTAHVKWMEARNIEVNDGWYKVGGGTAYIGWEMAFDCLMDGVKGTAVRHAPNMQWSTSGCVIRNGVFDSSDAQFHAGWPNENLIENCSIHSMRGESGSYGFGLFAQGPEGGGHGPQGPRNVIYNNDFSSEKSGIWLGGSNEGYLILYNRFRVEGDPAVLLKAGSFDHTFLGNVFIMKRPSPAAVVIMTPDCTGVSFVKNDFYGVSSGSVVFLGAIPPETNTGNRYLPYQEEVPRPKPEVPSIYEWQMKNK